MLATFTWMAANALSLYQAIVLVFKRNVQQFFVRASIAAWGEFLKEMFKGSSLEQVLLLGVSLFGF